MGDLLLEMGLLDEQTLEAAVAEQRTSGRRLPRILGDKRVVDEERLTKAVAAKLGLEVVNVSSLKIHERVLALIPAQIAIKYGVLPIAIKRANGAEFLYLVMADPLDSEAIGEVQRVTGRQVRVLMASASEVDTAIDTQYRAIQGKHVPPMPPATPPPPPQPPPNLAAPPAKPINPPAMRKLETPPAAPPPAPRNHRPISAPASAPLRPTDPATGGPTELVRAAMPSRTHQTTPAPRAAPPSKVPTTPPRATPPQPPPPTGLRRASKPEPFRLTAQDLIHPMPLDALEEEPKTRIDDHVPQQDWDLAVRDWSPPGGLSQPAGNQQSRSEVEPVTTEARLANLDPDHDEPAELIEIEAEDISTSQIELEELSEVQVIAMQAQPVHLDSVASSELVRAFEIPIEIDEANHPFGGPTFDDVPTGLERTGIIPAIDFSSDHFEPPPLPESGRPNRALIGGDIPMSKAAVEARQSVPPTADLRTDADPRRSVPALDFVAALDVAPPPPKKKSDPPAPAKRMDEAAPASVAPRLALARPDDSDADAMPVIEPSSLMSLMDAEPVQEDTGSDEVPGPAFVVQPPPATRLFDESTNPRIETSSVPLADLPEVRIEDLEDPEPTPSSEEVDRDAVLSALDGQFSDPIVMEQPVEMTEIREGDADDRARDLVRALMQGRSLKSAERAELVLALGRLLIKNGVIDEEELALELTLDADR